MKEVCILGYGGNSIDVADCFSSDYHTYFLDDDKNKIGMMTPHGLVHGPLSEATNAREDMVFINTIGSTNNFYRKADIINGLNIPIERFISVTHPHAFVSKTSSIQPGVAILANTSIGARTAVACHVMILQNTLISHDCTISDYCTIAGGVTICGGVTVGPSTYIGAGASIISGVTIGECCLIGMGAVVLDDVPDNTVVVGNPARAIRATKCVEVGI